MSERRTAEATIREEERRRAARIVRSADDGAPLDGIAVAIEDGPFCGRLEDRPNEGQADGLFEVGSPVVIDCPDRRAIHGHFGIVAEVDRDDLDGSAYLVHHGGYDPKKGFELSSWLAIDEVQAPPAELRRRESPPDGRLEALESALRLAVRWMGDAEDPLGTFEDIGEWFYRETGYLRPGKSEPLECGARSEERDRAWKEWAAKTRTLVRATCLAALSSCAPRKEEP